jgi:hypothetical protein
LIIVLRHYIELKYQNGYELSILASILICQVILEQMIFMGAARRGFFEARIYHESKDSPKIPSACDYGPQQIAQDTLY